MHSSSMHACHVIPAEIKKLHLFTIYFDSDSKNNNMHALKDNNLGMKNITLACNNIFDLYSYEDSIFGTSRYQFK